MAVMFGREDSVSVSQHRLVRQAMGLRICCRTQVVFRLIVNYINCIVHDIQLQY